MWDFCWHLRGTVPLDGQAQSATTLDCVERLLDRQQKAVSERGSDYVVFDDKLWSNPMAPNWLAMVIYDHGKFWIEHSPGGQSLRYDLRSLHGFIFCLFCGLMFFVFGLIAGGFLVGIGYALGAFAWLYGMNMVLAFVRVPDAIREAVTNDKPRPHFPS